jgi:hypothetical protein
VPDERACERQASRRRFRVEADGEQNDGGLDGVVGPFEPTNSPHGPERRLRGSLVTLDDDHGVVARIRSCMHVEAIPAGFDQHEPRPLLRAFWRCWRRSVRR